MIKDSPKKMRWIGLTGGIATGKSTIARLFEGRGIPVVDADRISHEIIEKGGQAFESVIQNFGPGILDESGQISRKKLGQIVFSDVKKLRDLEGLLHPIIQQEVQRRRTQYEDSGFSYAIYDVPLLFEAKTENLFDGIIVVGCSRDQQIARMKERNKWSDDEILRRLDSQLPIEEKRKRATWYVDNSKDFPFLMAQFAILIGQIETGIV